MPICKPESRKQVKAIYWMQISVICKKNSTFTTSDLVFTITILLHSYTALKITTLLIIISVTRGLILKCLTLKTSWSTLQRG